MSSINDDSAILEIIDSGSEKLPFNYYCVTKAFSPKFAEEILFWLENDAKWFLKETDFYEQWEFSLEDIKNNHPISEQLKSLYFKSIIKKKMENFFNTVFENDLKIAFHKMLKNQTIRIHNDYLQDGETHRLIVQLNNNSVNGGYLILFNSDNPQDIHKVINPNHNTGIMFAISKKSYHAVSSVHEGSRYTFVCSLKEKIKK